MIADDSTISRPPILSNDTYKTHKFETYLILGTWVLTISKFKVTTSVTYNKEADATKRTKKTNKTTKFVSASKSKLALTVKYDDKAADTVNQQTAAITVKYSPTKVGYKGMKWKAANSKIVYVSPTGIVTPLKKGTTKVYGYTKDGTNKKVTLNVTVNAAPVTATPTPNYEPEDTRTKTVVEDFESYDVGYNWESDEYKGTSGKATKGKEYVNNNCGSMTVVQDPEDPNNKCLKIDYNGDTQAYDYAPIFDLKMPKTLDEYSGVMIDSRIVSSNTGDPQYKTVAAYFSKYQKITPEYYFDTSLKEDDAVKKGISKELIKFSVDASHATGRDEKYNVKGGSFDGMTYNNKTFPMFYNDWATDKKDENRTVGYKESENDTYKAGWHQNKLGFNKGNITEAGVLTAKNFSMVIGSTYAGMYGSKNASLTLYLDNLTFLEGETPCTEVKIENPPTRIAKGAKMSVSADKISYVPDNTTQTQLTWSSSNENILKIDGSKSNPVLEGVAAGKATITATVTKNPAVKKSFEVEVFAPAQAVSDLTIDLSSLSIIPKKDDKDTTTKLFSTIDKATKANGVLGLEFTQANNDMYVLDLGQTYDLSGYQGFSIVGIATEQMSLELYPDTANFQEDKYWTKQIQFATYPFFEGSHAHRSYEGTSYGEVGVEEEFKLNWYDGVDSKGNKVEGTVPAGNLTNIRYVVLKANKYNTALPSHEYKLKTLTFKKDWYENKNPTDAEIKEHGGEWFEKN